MQKLGELGLRLMVIVRLSWQEGGVAFWLLQILLLRLVIRLQFQLLRRQLVCQRQILRIVLAQAALLLHRRQQFRYVILEPFLIAEAVSYIISYSSHSLLHR